MNTPMDEHNGLSAVDYDPFAAPALERVVPSTEAQREIWLAAKLGEDASLAYNEAVALQLRGTLDAAALLDALQALVDRHDALRASFGPDGETFCVAAGLALAVRQADLSALDASAREAALEERRTQTVLLPFDLENGPLFRAELLRLEDGTHCEEASSLAEHKLKDVREKMTDLARMESVLSELVCACHLRQGNVSCPLIASLQGKKEPRSTDAVYSI